MLFIFVTRKLVHIIYRITSGYMQGYSCLKLRFLFFVLSLPPFTWTKKPWFRGYILDTNITLNPHTLKLISGSGLKK